MGALSKKDVVTLALHEMGGEVGIVDTEDVAIAAHRRAPIAFGWRKHTEHIDLEAARTSLRHEAEAMAARIAGSIRTGWHLTPAGVAWVEAHAAGSDRAEHPGAASPKVAARRSETRHTGAETDRLGSSAAFRDWTLGREVSARDAAAVFRIDHYTSERDRHLKTRRIRLLVDGDDELAAFIDAMSPLAISLEPPTSRPAAVGESMPSGHDENGRPAK